MKVYEAIDRAYEFKSGQQTVIYGPAVHVGAHGSVNQFSATIGKVGPSHQPAQDTLPSDEDIIEAGTALMEQHPGMRFSEALYAIEADTEPVQEQPCCDASAEDIGFIATVLVKEGIASSFADALMLLESGG